MTRVRRIVGIATLLASIGALFVAAPAHASSPQEAATQIQGQPNTFYWAVIVGINDYDGNTEDLKGAVQDAQSLYNYFLSLGWRKDHIALITDKAATRQTILNWIGWLARKTNNKSAAVFHFSGHEMPFTVDRHDGQGRVMHIAMRTRENDFIYDDTFGSALGQIHAYRMWIDLSLCRAGGFNRPGTITDGRIATYSSPKTELSYEDPSLKHSVMSYYSIVQAMQNKSADANHDGQVTVEEAFNWAKGRVTNYTGGKQHPQMTDKVWHDFIVKPPK